MPKFDWLYRFKMVAVVFDELMNELDSGTTSCVTFLMYCISKYTAKIDQVERCTCLFFNHMKIIVIKCFW